jgi:hypothetical protein
MRLFHQSVAAYAEVFDEAEDREAEAEIGKVEEVEDN